MRLPEYRQYSKSDVPAVVHAERNAYQHIPPQYYHTANLSHFARISCIFSRHFLFFSDYLIYNIRQKSVQQIPNVLNQYCQEWICLTHTLFSIKFVYMTDTLFGGGICS